MGDDHPEQWTNPDVLSGYQPVDCAAGMASASEPRQTGWVPKGLKPWGWTPEATTVLLRTLYSDDDGHSWKVSEPITPEPFMAAIPHGCGPLFEDRQGTVCMPVWAWRSEREYRDAALLRSSDGGLTWKAGSMWLVETRAVSWLLEKWRCSPYQMAAG